MKQIAINGMSCEHCVKSVTEALEELGLSGVSVSLEKGVASFDETSAVTHEALTAAIDDIGFEAGAIS